MPTPWSFVAVPKTGSRSICEALGMDISHRRASELPGFRFAFVRDPYQRLVSTFHFCRDAKYGQNLIDLDEPFRSFVMRRGWIWLDTPLFRPQSYWLNDNLGFIGRFEHLEEDFTRVCSIIDKGDCAALPRLHVTNASEKYDSVMRRIVYHEYQEDFIRYGYPY